jgi:hypothetical protein
MKLVSFLIPDSPKKVGGEQIQHCYHVRSGKKQHCSHIGLGILVQNGVKISSNLAHRLNVSDNVENPCWIVYVGAI